MVLKIGLDEKTSQDLEQIARMRAIEPETLAREAIRSFLRTEAQQVLEREARAFREMHPELLKTMPGEFVAVHQGRVIDHDEDQLALYGRIEDAYPGQPILLRQVRAEPEQTIEVRSPRIENG